jgi:NADPH:quinone reductase-like Zn-dependent oxidoreductase
VDPYAAVGDLDLVVDAFGGPETVRWLPTLRPGGLLVPVTGAPRTLAEQAARHHVRAALFLVEPDASGLAALAELAAAGQLRVLIQAAFPLAEAAAAHELGEQGRTLGKIVLLPWASA